MPAAMTRRSSTAVRPRPGRTARQQQPPRTHSSRLLRRGHPPQANIGVGTGRALAMHTASSPTGPSPMANCRRPGTTTAPTTGLAQRHHVAVARLAEGTADLPPGSDPVPGRHRRLLCGRRHPVALTSQARYAIWKNNRDFGPKAVCRPNQPARRPLTTTFSTQITRSSEADAAGLSFAGPRCQPCPSAWSAESGRRQSRRGRRRCRWGC
jgi:hypothetical protein